MPLWGGTSDHAAPSAAIGVERTLCLRPLWLDVWVLTPSPLALTNLVVAAMGQPWPTTEVGRQAYFAALDFCTTEGFNGVSQRHRFTTALQGVEGDWGSDDFTGFSLFAYGEPGNGGSLARQGFAEIKELIAVELGPPNETWGAPDSPACVWLADQLNLEMYCHQKGSSSLQIGLGRADLESKTGAEEVTGQLVDHRMVVVRHGAVGGHIEPFNTHGGAID